VNVEYETLRHTSNHWGHRTKIVYMETKLGKHSTNALQSSCTGDIAHNKESATVWNLKPEWWGAPLVEGEKYRGKGNLW